jgi:hypothetical protein
MLKIMAWDCNVAIAHDPLHMHIISVMSPRVISVCMHLIAGQWLVGFL